MDSPVVKRRLLSPEKESAIAEALKDADARFHLREIAFRIEVNYKTVYSRFVEAGGVPLSRSEMRRYQGREPTEEQIRAACAEIQKGWSEDVRREREVPSGSGPMV